MCYTSERLAKASMVFASKRSRLFDAAPPAKVQGELFTTAQDAEKGNL